jgi:hypothetical protein
MWLSGLNDAIFCFFEGGRGRGKGSLLAPTLTGIMLKHWRYVDGKIARPRHFGQVAQIDATHTIMFVALDDNIKAYELSKVGEECRVLCVIVEGGRELDTDGLNDSFGEVGEGKNL